MSLLINNRINQMAKRATSLHPHVKSKHSRKTKKRLAVKKVMLETKAAGRKTKKK